MRLFVVSHACATPINQHLYAEVQRQTGWDVSLVVPSNWRDEYGHTVGGGRWPSFHGELIPVPVWKPGHIILHAYQTSFARLIRARQPDAVYVHHEPYAVAAAQVYWGYRRASGRGPIGFYTAQNILKKYPPPFRWTEAAVLNASQFAFPVSATVASVFRRKGYRGMTAVLPLAIDPNVYHPQPPTDTTRAELVGGADVLLGYVGRLVPEKGLRTLWSALNQILDMNWTFAVVGAGPLEAELRATAATTGLAERVRFCGFVPHADAPRLLSAMDVLVLPSETQSGWREQFGRVLLEALACETAVLGSDSGEIPVLINDTGGGLVFPERDAGALAAALRRLIGDPTLRRRLAVAGAAAVADRYSIAAAAHTFADVVTSATVAAVVARSD